MKKIYTAPEAELLCFEPQENLAFNGVSLTGEAEGGMGAGVGNGSSNQLSNMIPV